MDRSYGPADHLRTREARHDGLESEDTPPVIVVGCVRRALLGSVAHAVLHEADRPVTVVPDRMPRRRAEAVAAEVV